MCRDFSVWLAETHTGSIACEENVPDGYKLTDTSVNGTITTFTNTELTEASVLKVWNDGENADNTRPDTLTVKLF